MKPGTRLGPYEIVAPIGAGGMGEVYRATDTKLKRDVALDGRFLMIKTPEELAPRQVNIVLNWFEELERLVPAE